MRVASVGSIARVVMMVAACAAAAACVTSGSAQRAGQPGDGEAEAPPPASEPMDAARALGLWRSTFGAVKIEPDSSHGGLPSGSVQGVWVYQREGQDVVGYFAGTLKGNVLQFHWQEPSTPPLTGQGYVVFDAQGRQYSGRWWSDRRDRIGEWSGWRQPAQAGGGPSGAAQGNSDPSRRPVYPRAPYRQPRPYQPPQPPDPAQAQPDAAQPQDQQPAYSQPQPYQQPVSKQQPYYPPT